MRRKFALLIAVFSFIFSVRSEIGYAQEACDQIIVDEIGVFENGMPRVEAAVQELVQLGADVRVRTVRTVGSAGNLDRLEEQIRLRCPSWRGTSELRKNNLLVFMFAEEQGELGLYFGEQWDSALRLHYIRIQTDVMAPFLVDGNFPEGFARGMEAVYKQLNSYLHPSVSSPQSREAVDLSGLWKVLMWIVILAALGGALYGSYRILSVHNSTRAKKRAAQQGARLEKQGSASRINQMPEQLQMLAVKIAAAAGDMAGEDAQQIKDEFNQIEGLVDAATEEYGDLDHSAGDPEQEGLSEQEYSAIEQAYQSVLNKLRDAQERATHLEERLRAIGETKRAFPDLKAKALAAVESALERVQQAQANGFKTTNLESRLAAARDSIARGDTLFKENKYIQAADSVKEATEIAIEISEIAVQLPQIKRESEEIVSVLEGRIEKVKVAVAAGAQVFDSLSSRYAASSWEPVQGNGLEAQNRITWSSDALGDARQKVEDQEWDAVRELADDISDWLDEAESLIRSIHALAENLETAMRESASEIDAAVKDIKKAWEYIQAHDDDIREELEENLRLAEKVLEEARQEHSQSKPDYLRVVKLAQQANTSADVILANARKEHETAERLRTQAASALRNARMSVSKASEYIEDHQRVVENDAVVYLTNARKWLEEAETSGQDLSRTISFAENAESEADKAYSKASEDVGKTHRSVSHSWGTTSSTPIRHRTSGGGGSSIRIGRSGGGGGGSVRIGRSGGGGGGSIRIGKR